MDSFPEMEYDGGSPFHRRYNSFSGTNATFPSMTDCGRSAISYLWDPPFDDQCILSFDGGGIRGYSSLIITRRLMRKIEKIETEDYQITTSYSPETYTPCVNNVFPRPTGRASSGSDGSKQECPPSPSACGECCRFLPCHYFDYIGGTSTGGLISIMLGRLRMSVDACIEEYKTLSKDIFGHPRWASMRGPIPWPRDKYNGKCIQRAVENVVKNRMSQAQRQVGAGNFNSPAGLCRTVVFAYAEKVSDSSSEYGTTDDSGETADAEDSSPYIFRSYDHWGSDPPKVTERNPGPAHSIPIWQVARATTAAPMYFDTITISNRKFGDGGFGTNNPASELLYEVLNMNGNDTKSIKLLLSVGTGLSRISRYQDGWLGKYVGYINAMRKLASDSENTHKDMEKTKKVWKIPYHRLNVPEELGLGEMKLDEYKQTTLAKIERITEKYCDSIEEELLQIAKTLVEHRRRRSRSDLWSLVSTGNQYRCTYEKCRRSQELLQRKNDLHSHLKEGHDLPDKDLRKYTLEGTCPPVRR